MKYAENLDVAHVIGRGRRHSVEIDDLGTGFLQMNDELSAIDFFEESEVAP